MPRKIMLPAMAILALSGAGCFGQNQAQSTPQAQNTVAQTAKMEQAKSNAEVVSNQPTAVNLAQAVPDVPQTATATVPAMPQAAITSSTLFTVDETWQVYSNEALNFDFRWPTKGRYAPEWSVEFRKADDASIQNGCVTDSKTANSESTYHDFCHSVSLTETEAVERTDYFTQKKGNQYIVITFFKKLYPADKNKANSSTDYESMLETIISTFKFN